MFLLLVEQVAEPHERSVCVVDTRREDHADVVALAHEVRAEMFGQIAQQRVPVGDVA